MKMMESKLNWTQFHKNEQVVAWNGWCCALQDQSPTTLSKLINSHAQKHTYNCGPKKKVLAKIARHFKVLCKLLEFFSHYSHQSSWRTKTNIDNHERSHPKSREIGCLHSLVSMNAQPANIKHTKQHVITQPHGETKGPLHPGSEVSFP